MPRLTNHHAVAEVLRENPPVLDDVGKARIEKRLLEAVRSPRPAQMAEAPSRARVFWLAGGVAVAAAAVLGFLALQPGPTAGGLRAQFETYDDTTRQRGTLEVGSTLRTDDRSEGDLGFADSRVHIERSTVLYLSELSSENIVLELTRGQIRVEFHPRVRGEEHLSIRTPHAMVEVVGTVFVVHVTEHWTVVSVTEGQVRVVDNENEEHMVGAHDAVTVGVEPEVVETETADSTPAPRAPGSAVEENATAHTERARRLATPAQRLSVARSLVRRDESARAMTILREVASARDTTPRIRAQAYTLLGDVLRRANRNEEARAAYEGAIRQRAGSWSHSAIYVLGRLQERRLGDRDAARASYLRYIVEAPGGPLAGASREALCRLGDTTMCH